MKVAVVIPALDEQAALPGAIASAWAAGADEVVVADGGSSDGTPGLVLPPATLVVTPRGRARQLNAGWNATTAPLLIFLHADSRLPPGSVDAARRAMAGGAVGGAFHKQFDSERWLLRHADWRTHAWWRLGLFFGDQAQFVRRDILQRLGGFREEIPAEDMDLARRLRRVGSVCLVPLQVQTSARRLETHGILRTWAAWWRVALAQMARETCWGRGAPPLGPAQSVSSEPESRPCSSRS